MNEQYIARFSQAEQLPHAHAYRRLAYLKDIIDFDSIKTICDIGSRWGEQAVELAEIFPQAEIHAFEPVPENFQLCLKRQIEFNKLDIKFHNVALGERTCLIPFFPVNNQGNEHNLGASSKYRFIEGRNGGFLGKSWFQDEIQVVQRSLDSYNLPVDLIWMDAQGSELDVLRGGKETLRSVQAILTEVGTDSYYEGQSLKPDVDAFLATHGFYELTNSQEYCHQYEINTIYLKR